MRILYWTQLFWPSVGGVEVLGQRLVVALRDRGHEILVVTSHDQRPLPDSGEYQGIPIRRFQFDAALRGQRPTLLVELRRGVARLKQEFRPDLVHFNLTDPSVFFHLQTATAQPAAFLLTTCVAMTQAAAGPDSLLGQALRSANWVSTNSRAMLADLRRLEPAITPRSSVIYNGLELPDLEPTPLPTAEPRLLCLGRVVPDKGFDLAIAAFAGIADRFPRARLTIAGGGPDLDSLRRQSREAGLVERVDFPGWIPPTEVPALINTATAVVMPSRWREAFGLVALEGSQLARPVIASRVGGLPEVVEDGVTGLLVEREDVDGLAAAMAHLLADPVLASRLGAQGRDRARQEFSWAAHVAAYDDLYRSLGGLAPLPSPTPG